MASNDYPTAYLVTGITVKDPETGNLVDITIFKHPGGGLFGIDSSFWTQSEQVVDLNDSDSDIVIPDPFGTVSFAAGVHFIADEQPLLRLSTETAISKELEEADQRTPTT